MIKVWKTSLRSPGPEQILLQELDGPWATLDEFSLQIPAGAYTTFRTYEQVKALTLDVHFSRLEETSKLEGIPILLDHMAIRSAIRSILPVYPDGEARIRLTVPFGSDVLYISCEKLVTPSPEMYEKGVEVVTKVMSRSNPKAKVSTFIQTSSSLKKLFRKKDEEILMVSPTGLILEGVSSNFFAIRLGCIQTAEEEVLSGTTRSIILSLIDELEIPIQKTAFPLFQIQQIDEAFISSVSRGILPVVRIDGILVGRGIPGPITKRLSDAFNHAIQKRIELI